MGESPPAIDVIARALYATQHADLRSGHDWDRTHRRTKEQWRDRARPVVDALAAAGMLR